jgi:catechol 2,3-dioxygenase-like lactoylglutathione lyase family enzyme
MVKRFDHVTFVVRDMDEAKRFFGLLGFQVDLDVMISGDILERYMGIEGLRAQHVTLVLTNSPGTPGSTAREIQSPQPHPRSAYQRSQ